MFRHQKFGSHDISPKSGIGAGGDLRAQTAELNQSRLPHEAAEGPRARFHRAEASVLHQVRSGALSAPRELLPVIAALTALELPVVRATSGFETSAKGAFPGFPTVVVSESPRPFELRFNGQREVFAENLREISVPIGLRIRHFFSIGLGALTPEGCVPVLQAAERVRYPNFLSAIERAYDSSVEATKANRPSEDEGFRRESNVALAKILEGYINDFRSDHRASVGTPITLCGKRGEPVCLVAGNPLESDSSFYDLSRDSLRARVIGERQRALLDFASFLKDRALLGQ